MTRLQQLLREKKQGPLLGAAAYFNDPIFIEICSYLGFSVMWSRWSTGTSLLRK